MTDNNTRHRQQKSRLILHLMHSISGNIVSYVIFLSFSIFMTAPFIESGYSTLRTATSSGNIFCISQTDKRLACFASPYALNSLPSVTPRSSINRPGYIDIMNNPRCAIIRGLFFSITSGKTLCFNAVLFFAFCKISSANNSGSCSAVHPVFLRNTPLYGFVHFSMGLRRIAQIALSLP